MGDTVVDVHTHQLSREWWDMVGDRGRPYYEIGTDTANRMVMRADGAIFFTPMPPHFDYDLRIKAMNEVGVDIAIITLTAPNCFFGTAEDSLKVGSSRVDLQACKLEYSIVSPK